MFSIIHHNKQKFKRLAMCLLPLVYILAFWTDNIFLNMLIFFIGIASLSNLYFSMFTSVINKKQLDLEMNKYPKWRKFLMALVTILQTNLCWVPTLLVVDVSAKFVLTYSLLSDGVVINIGSSLLILIPLAINLITFYYFKNSIIAYKDYFKSASTFILLCIPLIFLIDAYWPLGIVTLLKDAHSWGLTITAPLFRFLIEIHTMEDPKPEACQCQNTTKNVP
jgi:hypothetical protein